MSAGAAHRAIEFRVDELMSRFPNNPRARDGIRTWVVSLMSRATPEERRELSVALVERMNQRLQDRQEARQKAGIDLGMITEEHTCEVHRDFTNRGVRSPGVQLPPLSAGAETALRSAIGRIKVRRA